MARARLTRNWYWCFAAAWGLVPGVGLAQSGGVGAGGPDQPTPSPQPTHTPSKAPAEGERELERVRKDLQDAATRRAPILPVAEPTLAPASPQAGQAGMGRGRLVREGTVLVGQRGRVSANDRGELVIVFDPASEPGAGGDAATTQFPPMVLLPSQYAAQVARLRERSGGAVTVRVSGQVTAYHGRNFLLLNRPAEAVRAAPAPTPSASAAPAASPTGPAATPPGGDADRLMAELEQAASRAESAGPGGVRVERLPVAPDEAPSVGVREGTFLNGRRGRMLRTPSGGWSLVFDAAPDARGDAPVELMPCANLMAMEDLAMRGGEALSLVVSGPVYSQGGRSFLLPTMYVVQPRAAR